MRNVENIVGDPKKRAEALGRIFETKTSGSCIVVEYINALNVTVLFQNPEAKVKCRMGHLRNGSVRNPMLPFICNKGFVGVGEYDTVLHKPAYETWRFMLLRVYGESHIKRKPTYQNVEVCEEWWCFQNFAKWYYEQKSFKTKDNKDKSYHLDKDILVKGNKVYSPETCCFVPCEVNNLLLTKSNLSKNLPTGVSSTKHKNKFRAQLSKNGVSVTLGIFSTPEEAFQVYKKAKELYIKEVAERWKGKIDDKVYEVLMKYKVEISD